MNAPILDPLALWGIQGLDKSEVESLIVNAPICRDQLEAVTEQRDAIYAEVAGWVRDCQDYFPSVRGLHDVFCEIEKLQSRIAVLEASRKAMDAKIYYAEWLSKDGKRAGEKGVIDGVFDMDAHGEYFDFCEFFDKEVTQ